MGKSVWPVDGLHSGSQGLAEGDTEVTGLCPSVFVCAAIVYCVCLCVCVCEFLLGVCTYVCVISRKRAVIHQR